MPTELDHTINEQRIESILEDNTSLYDASNTDGTKLINIEEGMPFVTEFITETLPGAFVSFESERFVSKGIVSGNELQDIDHEVRYRIRIMVGGLDAKSAEIRLNSFQKLILQSLEGNVQLTSSGTDPKCDFSRPDFITRIKESNEVVQARDIILKCLITTN